MKLIRLLAIILFSHISFKGVSQNSLIHPMNYFFSKSKSVEEKSYYANVSVDNAIQYFKNIGMTRYSVREHNSKTIRFRNSAKTVFVMVFRISNSRVYIVMSRSQYVDEINA